MLQLKALHATAKTQRSQLNEYLKVGGGSSVTIENCNILGKEKTKDLILQVLMVDCKNLLIICRCLKKRNLENTETKTHP